jgi:hypothetical protein
MRKDKRNNCEPKGVYRVRNWSEYNAGLIARGSVTMWINESALTMVSEAEPVMRGRAARLLGCTYSGSVAVRSAGQAVVI